MENLIVTIDRQYGTGGHEIGRKLAQQLDIAFYDRALITRVAKKTGIDEEMLEQLDKCATNSFLYFLTMFGAGGANGMSLADQLYLAQANTIREIAQEGSCVIVGLCSDHVLRDYPNRVDFFIHASIQDRVKRIQTCGEYEIIGRSPESSLEKMDKHRSTYYNYYAGKVWGRCDHYDLCVNAGRLGVERSVEVLFHYIQQLQFNT